MFELVQAISIDAAAGRALGRAHVPLSAALDDHFPGAPHVPGTWLLELAAQIAGPLAEEASSDTRTAILGHVRSAVFRTPVPAPADLTIEAHLLRRDPASAVCRVTLFPDSSRLRNAAVLPDSALPESSRLGNGAMSAELGFALIAVSESAIGAWELRNRRVERWRGAW